MLTKAGVYTFFLGTRVGDAAAPPFLKFRSSSAFIIATISLAIFTVSLYTSKRLASVLTYLGYISLLGRCACIAICLDGQSRC